VVTTNGTVVHHYIPRPEGNSVPLWQPLVEIRQTSRAEAPTYLLHLEALFTIAFAIAISGSTALLLDDGGGRRRRHRGIGHVDVGHDIEKLVSKYFWGGVVGDVYCVSLRERFGGRKGLKSRNRRRK